MQRECHPFEQPAGIGEPATGAAEMIGIEAHALLKWSAAREVPLAAQLLSRRRPSEAIDGGHQVMAAFQQGKG
jgi:hypothetical protein